MDQAKHREIEFHNELFAQRSQDHDPRSATDKYYATIKNSRGRYAELIAKWSKGADVLEYGCGSEGYSLGLATTARSVHGIDISDVAIEEARKKADQLGLTNAKYDVMDAENMTFPSAQFDVVFGSGILHHLNVEKSAAEIARVLRPGGVAIFTEPMGHNPAINLYRTLTPKIRSVDEHPFKVADFRTLEKYFGKIDYYFHNLLSTAAFIFKGTSFFAKVLKVLEDTDQKLFRTIPYLQRHAWMVIFVCTKSKD